MLQIPQQPIATENKKLGRVAGNEPRAVTLRENGSNVKLDRASELTSLVSPPEGGGAPSQSTVTSNPSFPACDRTELPGVSKPAVLALANEAQVFQQPVTSVGINSISLGPVLQSGSSLGGKSPPGGIGPPENWKVNSLLASHSSDMAQGDSQKIYSTHARKVVSQQGQQTPSIDRFSTPPCEEAQDVVDGCPPPFVDMSACRELMSMDDWSKSSSAVRTTSTSSSEMELFRNNSQLASADAPDVQLQILGELSGLHSEASVACAGRMWIMIGLWKLMSKKPLIKVISRDQ